MLYDVTNNIVADFQKNYNQCFFVDVIIDHQRIITFLVVMLMKYK